MGCVVDWRWGLFCFFRVNTMFGEVCVRYCLIVLYVVR